MIKREKTLLVIAVLVILIGSLYTSIIVPFFKKIRSLNSEIIQNQKLIERMQKEASQQIELEKKFSFLARKIKAKLPFKREESQFLSEIGKVAKETNIHISLMNPLPSKDIGNFKEFSVEIDMEANLGNLVRFLYQMRKSSVVLVANKLELQPKSERSALLKGKLIISTIFLKEKSYEK